MQSMDAPTLSFDDWLGALRKVCGSFDSTPLHRQSFSGSVSRRCEGGIEIAGIKTNVERIARRWPFQRSDDSNHCFLIVQKQGRATLVQNGAKLDMRPGEMALLDSAEESEIFPHGLIEHDSFHLPREEVIRRFGHQSVPFMKINADCASGQILQLVVSRIVAGQLAQSETNSGISDSLIALLPSIHQHQLSSAPLLEQGGDMLYLCIQQFIDQHLQEDELGPGLLAAQFNLSIRQLYRLFEKHNETICRYVQRRRLERCAEELASPAQTNWSITQIAYKWGFSDSAHFSRSFKREFDSSPREYRRSRLACVA